MRKKTRDKIERIFHWVAAFTYVLAFVLILYYGYYLLWPFNIIDVKEPMKVLNPNKQVALGDALIYEEDYCKYVSIPATTTVTLHNEVIVGLPVRHGNIPLGCHKRVSFQRIPETPLIVGKAYVEFIHTYRINAIRTVSDTSTTEEFEIVDGKK
jgi:hypothetical protein